MPGLAPTDHARFHLELPGYRLEVLAEAAPDGRVRPEAVAGAERVAAALRRGIDEADDLCALTGVCRYNLGLPRTSMPQAPAERVAELLASTKDSDRTKGQAAVAAGADPESPASLYAALQEHLRVRGVILTEAPVAVGTLRATQREIKAAKVLGMADSWLRGTYDPAAEPFLVSGDGYVFDGHHRWAALLLVEPEARVQVLRASVPMLELLALAYEVPGVYRMDLHDRPVAVTAPLDLGRLPGSTWQQGRLWYGKSPAGVAAGPYGSRAMADLYASGLRVRAASSGGRRALLRYARQHPEWRGVLLPLVFGRP